MAHKWNFWDFDKNLIHSLCTFLLQCKSISGLPTFCKNHIFRKYGPKSSRLIRMQDVLNCSISKMIWGMKLKFYETRHLKKQQMQLLTSSGCVKQAEKLWILSFIPRIRWAMKLVFLRVVRDPLKQQIYSIILSGYGWPCRKWFNTRCSFNWT